MSKNIEKNRSEKKIAGKKLVGEKAKIGLALK